MIWQPPPGWGNNPRSIVSQLIRRWITFHLAIFVLGVAAITIRLLTGDLHYDDSPRSPYGLTITKTPTNLYKVSTPTATLPHHNISDTHSDLRRVVGTPDNYFCIPNAETHTRQVIEWVGIRSLPYNLRLRSPLARACVTPFDCFEEGTIVPSGASIMLDYRSLLLLDECPTSQQAALAEWVAQRSQDPLAERPLATEEVDALVGSSTWQCEDVSTIQVTLTRDLALGYPIMTVTSASMVYGVGETLPENTGMVSISFVRDVAVCMDEAL